MRGVTSGHESSVGGGSSPSPLGSSSSIAIFLVDASGIVTLCAGSSFPDIGLSGVDAVGRPIVDTAAPWLCAAARLALVSGEATAARGRAAGRSYECSCLPQRTAAGSLAGFAGWVADVTERTRIELAREDQEHLLHAVDVIIWKMNAADLRVVYATGALFLLGRPDPEWTEAPSFFSESATPTSGGPRSPSSGRSPKTGSSAGASIAPSRRTGARCGFGPAFSRPSGSPTGPPESPG